MKYLILGSKGFIGSNLTQYLRAQGHGVIDTYLDVNDSRFLDEFIWFNKPDVVVNLTGAPAYPTIDWCEDHKAETVQVNVGGAINVALACIKYNVYLIQISSGCIYGGGIDREFTEDDAPNFFGSFYSRMRIVMQDALKELPVLQIRIRMPISMKSHPRNFINKITSYTRVISVPNSVTLIEDLCPAIEKLASIRPTGILNLTNDGYIEHKNVLKIYKKIVNPDHLYIAITLEELEGSGGIIKAKRSNCILSNKKARELGISMPALDDERLEKIMEEYKKTL